jgi:SAM-dependent methyltransferase
MGFDETCARRATGVTLLALVLSPFGRGAKVEFTTYDAVTEVLVSYADRLPVELSNPNPAKWNAWNRKNDQAIRGRLERGERDSMVNLLLSGTSFTTQPRIGIADLRERTRDGVLKSRVNDLVRGLTVPGNNERLIILRGLLQRNSIELDTQDGPEKAGVYILENLTRVLEEKRAFATRSAKALDAPENSRETPPVLVERAELFRDRGVSLDTGILADFSVDLALRRLKDRGVLGPGRVARVAVIGPGLDFIDKDESAAFDYFPLQTLQPFALMDSLLRLDLSRKDNLSLTAFDISPLVIAHFQHARQQAEKKTGYVMQLPQDVARPWPPDLESYWRTLGNQTGTAAQPLLPPALFSGMRTRAVRVSPEVVLQCQAVDLDVVAQRLNLPLQDRFDLIVATNIFLYYDRFQQALALQNVASMMKPGGILLSNDELPILPASGMSLISVTAISDGGPGRDAVAAYRKN